MARFRATIKGSRGTASRLGTKKSGLEASINGWNIGVDVSLWVDAQGHDRITVIRTGGSNHRSESEGLVQIIDDTQ